MQTDIPPLFMICLWKKEKYFSVRCRAKREAYYFCCGLSFAGTQPLSLQRHHNILISDYHCTVSYNISSTNCIHFMDRGFVLKTHNFNINKSFVSVMDCIRKLVFRSRSTCSQRFNSTILFPFFLFFPAGFPVAQTSPVSYLWLLLRMTPKSKLTVFLSFVLVGQFRSKHLFSISPRSLNL